MMKRTMLTMKRPRLAFAFVLCLCAGTARGQDVPPDVIMWRTAEPAQGPGDAATRVGVIAFDPVSVGRVVQDAPYSGEAVTEVLQTLADGNRIEQRTTASVARDSRGRTRREQQGFAFGNLVSRSAQPIITITDPATGEHLTLDYGRKIAIRARPFSMKVDGAIGIERRVEVRRRTAGSGSGGDPQVNGAPQVIEERVFELPAPDGGPGMRVPPPIPGTPLPEGATRTETLDPTTLEGLRAEGTRTTMTIPAGAIGNAQPIEVVSERWYSPELQVVLMTRRVDPRFGETVYRLTGISRAEPAEDLFQIPADFRVEEGPGPLPRRRP
jgi:hypothetical protein